MEYLILLAKVVVASIPVVILTGLVLWHCLVLNRREEMRRVAARALARQMAIEKPAVEVVLRDPATCRHSLDRRQTYFEPFVGWLEVCKDCGHWVQMWSVRDA